MFRLRLSIVSLVSLVLLVIVVLLSAPELASTTSAASAAAVAASEESSRVTVTTLAEVDAGTGGIVVDATGNVYNSDFGAVLGDPSTAGTKVHRISPDGDVEVFLEGLEGASGSAFDPDGNFFQSNIRGGYVTRVTAAGMPAAATVEKFVSEGLQAPVGIVIDDLGTLYVANCGSGSIQRITPDGVSTRFVQDSLLNCPNGITRDSAGNLYVANFYNGNVIKITPEGVASKLATLPGNNNGHIVFAQDALYVVARGAHQIYEVSLSGEIKLVAGSGEKGGQDGDGSQASFCYPNDIAVAPDGRTLYVNDVADATSGGSKLGPARIRKLTFGAR